MYEVGAQNPQKNFKSDFEVLQFVMPTRKTVQYSKDVTQAKIKERHKETYKRNPNTLPTFNLQI